MKIAVATTDGLTVNEHFGRAEKFLIYNVTGTKFDLLMEKHVEPYSTGSKDHDFDVNRFHKVVKGLKGCAKIFVTKIGNEPAAALKEMGIEAVVYEGAVKDIEVS